MLSKLDYSLCWYMMFLLLLGVMQALAQFYGDSPSSLMIGPPPMTADDFDPHCWNFTYGNWRLQEFYTPNYPGEYLNNTDCVLYLDAPSGFKIHLDFRDKFVLEKSEGCKYDYLEVRDGPFAYSPLIARYCGAGFPPMITSSGRFLWLRFKTDDLLQYGGFRAVYSYHKDLTQNDGTFATKAPASTCRMLVQLSPDQADGVLSAEDIVETDLQLDPSLTKEESLDCTWELQADKGHGINLRSSELDLRNKKQCDVTNLTIYERTTLDSAIKGEYCQGNNERVDMTSDSNRVFIRLYGSSLSNKPNVKIIYSLVRKGECHDLELRCGDVCLPASLICNGVDNCQDRSDEKSCHRPRPSKGWTQPGGGGANPRGDGEDGVKKPSSVDDRKNNKEEETTGEEASLIPLHIIILAVVGGVIVTCASISLCIMCRLRRKEGEKRPEVNRQPASVQRNGLELALANSCNTTVSLSRQNNESHSPRPGGASDRTHYTTFAKMNPGSPSGVKDESHRYSLSDRTMPALDHPDYCSDLMTESGNYKRFLATSPEDMAHESLQLHLAPGKYPPSLSGGGVVMSSLEHRKPDGYPGYHVNQWPPNLSPESKYSYGPTSPNRPTPFLGLSKQFPYQQPDSKYESTYLKALKTIENDSIKELQGC